MNKAESKRKKPSNGKIIQQSLERLLSQGKEIKMPAAPPFALPIHTAHTWSIPQVVKYLDEVMELSQYTGQFLQGSISGKIFMSLMSNETGQFIPAILTQVTHALHLKKILNHASKVRTEVFNHMNPSTNDQKKEFEYTDVDVAHEVWQLCPNSLAIAYILQSNINGLKLMKMNPESLSKLFPDNVFPNDDERDLVTNVLKEFVNIDSQSEPNNSLQRIDSKPQPSTILRQISPINERKKVIVRSDEVATRSESSKTLQIDEKESQRVLSSTNNKPNNVPMQQASNISAVKGVKDEPESKRDENVYIAEQSMIRIERKPPSVSVSQQLNASYYQGDIPANQSPKRAKSVTISETPTSSAPGTFDRDQKPASESIQKPKDEPSKPSNIAGQCRVLWFLSNT